MGTNDDIDLENPGATPAGEVEISRLIREEVRAVVREQILATTSEPAPPSYDSTARLLATDAAGALNDPLDGAETASQDPRNQNPRRPGRLARLAPWLRVLISLGPIMAVFVSLPVMSLSGVDPLSLSLAAFFLLMGTYYLAMIGMIADPILKKAGEGTEQQAQLTNEHADSSASGLFLSYHFLFTYLLFGLILWWWFVSGEESLFSRFQLAARFDAKIETQDALSKLTACFYDKIPDRKVTIQDFTLCLAKLGIDPTP